MWNFVRVRTHVTAFFVLFSLFLSHPIHINLNEVIEIVLTVHHWCYLSDDRPGFTIDANTQLKWKAANLWLQKWVWMNEWKCVHCVTTPLESFIQCVQRKLLCERCVDNRYLFCWQWHVVKCVYVTLWHQITNSHFSPMAFFLLQFLLSQAILSKFSSLLEFIFGFSYHDIIIFFAAAILCC